MQHIRKLVRFIACFGWVLWFSSIVIAEQAPISQDKGLISLDFQEIDVRKALQLLAQLTQLNLVVENSVQGTISIHLSQVKAEEALRAILRLRDLTQHYEGNTCIIRSSHGSSSLADKESIFLDSKRIIVKNRSAKELSALFLASHSTKTKGSHLSVDTRSNSLWIQDTPKRIEALEKLVSAFDQCLPQILIEGRIVSMNRNFDRSLGVRLGLKTLSTPPVESKNEAIAETITVENTSEFLPLNVDLPSLNQAFNRFAPLLWTGFSKMLDLELAAMEDEGYGRIISSPHLITTDRTPALIEAGSEIPYQEKNRYGTSIAFKKAVLSLQVTPEVTPSGHILLKLELHHDKPSSLGIDKTPSIATQKLKTQVLIQSGETLALGGIYEKISQKSIYRVPGLGRIPLLGWLFSQKGQKDATHELLVFVTPHLVSDTLLQQRKESVSSL